MRLMYIHRSTPMRTLSTAPSSRVSQSHTRPAKRFVSRGILKKANVALSSQHLGDYLAYSTRLLSGNLTLTARAKSTIV